LSQIERGKKTKDERVGVKDPGREGGRGREGGGGRGREEGEKRERGLFSP
jgi:hypothetical protein